MSVSAYDHEEIGRRALNFLFDFIAVRPEPRERTKPTKLELFPDYKAKEWALSEWYPDGNPWKNRAARIQKAHRYRPNVGPWALGQRRLQTLAVALQRPEVSHVCGADIAREFGVTKQAINLDAQRIEKQFGIAMPTAHRGK